MMKHFNQLLVSKLEIPQAVPYAMERNSLLETICGCAERIVIIQGKAGYGKTELARQYCQIMGNRAMWYSLDDTDNQLLQFLACLEMTLDQERRIYTKEDLFCLNSDSENQWAVILESLQRIQILLNKFSEQSSVFVFDSFENIRNKDIFNLLQYLVNHSPQKLKFLFISRQQMPDFFYRYVVNGQCKFIDETALSFSREEQFKKIGLELKCSEKEANRILEGALCVLEGWPACVSLALVCLQKWGREDKNPNWEYFIHESMIYSFFDCEIFEKLQQEIKTSLFRCFALPEISEKTVSKAMLNQLIKMRLLIPQKDGDCKTFIFPHVFRIFLKAKADNETEIVMQDEGTDSRSGKKIQVQTFGDFSVRVIEHNKVLSWRTKKGSELFAYLVERNGQPAGRRMLMQKLWEDEIPDNAVTMFHNMIYNIRKELASCGIFELISYQNKMYRINMDFIETDWAHIKYICNLVDREEVKELDRNSDSLKFYWGRYLEDMDCQWAMEQREYFDTRFLKGSIMLADHSIKNYDFEDAVIFLKNARIVNPYSEDIIGNLIQCYGKLRNLKQVKAEYDNFCMLLERDLGIRAGEELKGIYQMVLTGGRKERKEAGEYYPLTEIDKEQQYVGTKKMGRNR